MKCPGCRAAETRTRETTDHGSFVMRLQRCEACGARWSTQETVVALSFEPARTPPVPQGQGTATPPVPQKGGLGVDPGSSLQLFSGSLPDASLESSSDRRSDGPKYSAGFLRVCAAYPKGRVGSKSEAWRSWGRHGGSALETPILAALAWQVVSDAWLKDGGAYVPHLCRYISKRRQDDDPPPPRRPAVHPKDRAAYDLVKEGFPGK